MSSNINHGRHHPTPPPPFTPTTQQPIVWPYPWNAPGGPIPSYLDTYEELNRREKRLEALKNAQQQLAQQPFLVRIDIQRRIDRRQEKSGIEHANDYLIGDVVRRILPRLNRVNEQYHIASRTLDTINHYTRFNQLPDMGRADIALLARDLAAHICQELRPINDEQTVDSDHSVAMALYTRAATLTQAFRQSPPRWATLQKRHLELDEITTALTRMVSHHWWLRRLHQHSQHWREHLHIALNNVHKKASPYASQNAISDWREQRRRTREFLKGLELEDEEGNRIALIDKYDGSIANPAIRRCELMTRIRGFENICLGLGYVGEFYTLTAPSKYHATGNQGHRNGKWQGANPIATQRYLCTVWQRIRAKLHREEIRIFGIRVAEPHHDGTPHWHLLLFMLPEHIQRVREICRHYAYHEDQHELINHRARKARFHAKRIDPKKGSATGYVAKYISKNIDGYALNDEKDHETDQPLQEMAKAVSAWASRWRIRQFQFIGGAPVTVYRELRRLSDHDQALGLSVEFASVHAAADSGDWAEYVNAQGGPFVRRNDLVVRTYYETDEKLNDYGDEIIRIHGVFSPLMGHDCPIITRTKKWKIVPKKRVTDRELALAFEGAPAPSWSSVNNCTLLKKPAIDNEPHYTPGKIDFQQLTAKERRKLHRTIINQPKINPISAEERRRKRQKEEDIRRNNPLRGGLNPRIRATMASVLKQQHVVDIDFAINVLSRGGLLSIAGEKWHFDGKKLVKMAPKRYCCQCAKELTQQDLTYADPGRCGAHSIANLVEKRVKGEAVTPAMLDQQRLLMRYANYKNSFNGAIIRAINSVF